MVQQQQYKQYWVHVVQVGCDLEAGQCRALRLWPDGEAATSTNESIAMRSKGESKARYIEYIGEPHQGSWIPTLGMAQTSKHQSLQTRQYCYPLATRGCGGVGSE